MVLWYIYRETRVYIFVTSITLWGFCGFCVADLSISVDGLAVSRNVIDAFGEPITLIVTAAAGHTTNGLAFPLCRSSINSCSSPPPVLSCAARCSAERAGAASLRNHPDAAAPAGGTTNRSLVGVAPVVDSTALQETVQTQARAIREMTISLERASNSWSSKRTLSRLIWRRRRRSRASLRRALPLLRRKRRKRLQTPISSSSNSSSNSSSSNHHPRALQHHWSHKPDPRRYRGRRVHERSDDLLLSVKQAGATKSPICRPAPSRHVSIRISCAPYRDRCAGPARQACFGPRSARVVTTGGFVDNSGQTIENNLLSYCIAGASMATFKDSAFVPGTVASTDANVAAAEVASCVYVPACEAGL